MPSIDSAFDWFLSATGRGSLLIPAVLLAQAALGRKLPPGWRHALWMPVWFALGSPALPESPFSLENRWSRAEPVAVKVMAAEPVVPPGILPSGMPSPASPDVARNPFRILAWIWGAGVVSVLGAGGVAWHRALATFRRRAKPLSPELAEEIRSAAREAGFRSGPKVLVSDAIPGPAISGMVRPLLLLPGSFTVTFPQEERRLILLHEMTHVKRGDLIFNALVFLFQALHWCNPLVWFAGVRFRTDRELACDHAVLSAATSDQRKAYGHALLRLESGGALPAVRLGSVGLVGLFGRGRALRRRLAAIAAHRPAHPASAIVGWTLFLGLTLAGATRATQDAAPEPGPPILIEAKFVEVPAAANIEVLSKTVTYEEKTGSAVFSPDSDALAKLEAVPGADVLSAPSVTTMSGQLAVVEIGPATPGGRGLRFEVVATRREEEIHLAFELFVNEPIPGSEPGTLRERKITSEATARPGGLILVCGLGPQGESGEGKRLYVVVRPRLLASASAGGDASGRSSSPN
jgi:beta-lactamase regulating signal transducer with metallopeptidase domain